MEHGVCRLPKWGWQHRLEEKIDHAMPSGAGDKAGIEHGDTKDDRNLIARFPDGIDDCRSVEMRHAQIENEQIEVANCEAI